ncbi:UMP kinase [Bacteroidota bacterium]
MKKYNRILLKLSGESLMGEKEYGIDSQRLNDFAIQIKEILDLGIEIAIVIGGGNIFRGVQGLKSGVDRVKGDYMGMLATVINGLALQSALENLGIKARVFTSVKMEPITEMYSKNKCVAALINSEIVIFSGGTGNPFFTTDTAATLRSLEIEADILFKGTRVDGVYSADPEENPEAEKYENISFDEVIKKDLKVMDITAFSMCRENNLPIIVFNMNKKGNLKKLISGEKIGTLIEN